MKVNLKVDIQDLWELFDILCEIEPEPTYMSDSEPNYERPQVIEDLLNQMSEKIKVYKIEY